MSANDKEGLTIAHAGTHTSACGTTAYRGDLLGAAYENSVFACEPVGHLVTRSIVRPSGVVLTAERARPTADFVASSDRWFRPASLATGPDGALYLADMYRLHVEHPKFLPDEIAQLLDWRAGEDRGRVYRIAPSGVQPRKFRPPQTTNNLLDLLKDPNGWRRHLAQRLLVERGARDAENQLASLLENADSPYTRLHALWTLAGLEVLAPRHVHVALADHDPHVRRDAVSLAAKFFARTVELQERVMSMHRDQDARVRFQVALALGTADQADVSRVLLSLAKRDGGDAWFADAILTSAEQRSGAILTGLLEDREFTTGDGSGRVELVRKLAAVVGARGDATEVNDLLNTIASSRRSSVWWPQIAALNGLATGLPRHEGALGKVSLTKLVANPPPKLSSSMTRVRQLLDKIQEVALDRSLADRDRVSAVEMLAFQTFDQASSAYRRLLLTDQPVGVQLACVRAMGTSSKSAAIILERWPALGPTVRGPALALLLRRTDTLGLALEAMAAGEINPAVMGLDQRIRLLRHGNDELRARAIELFGGAVSANRRAIAQEYNPALTLPADPQSGAKVFQRVCAKCHKRDGQGHEVGPDISDVRNRSGEALLYDILDPNRKLEPRYTDYSIVTEDGRVLNGLMISETAKAVILRQAEGKQEVIARNQIDEIRASGKSLMPEGVEKEVSIQQMADLLAYLKNPNFKQ